VERLCGFRYPASGIRMSGFTIRSPVSAIQDQRRPVRG